jgi:hypothetical protein
MKPLIEIRTIPISIQYKVNNAQVERQNAKAEVEIRRDKGGLSIKSRPIRLNIDSFEARNSISPSTRRSVEESAGYGQQAAYSATATIAREGNMMVDIHLREPAIPKIASDKTNPPPPDFNIKFVPDKPIDVSWYPQNLQIEYEMDKLNFDWQTNNENFHFTPANIEFTIQQHPQVIIEYVGSPIYVPPSANPNYEPVVDTRA